MATEERQKTRILQKKTNRLLKNLTNSFIEFKDKFLSLKRMQVEIAEKNLKLKKRKIEWAKKCRWNL